jgi:hypothetical protein
MKSHDIKDILEARRIEVSENSWDKLAGKLDANDRTQQRKKFYLPYVASLAVLISVVIVMLLNSDTVEETQIADTEKTTKSIITKENTQPIVIPQKEEKVENILEEDTQLAVEDNTPKIIKEVEKKTEIIQKTDKELATELQQAVAIQEKIIPQKIETVIQEKEAVLAEDEALKESILAILKEEKVTVTNAEIDLLLQQAQQSLKELDVQETIDYTNFATADQLLNEVEYELDMSFKQRVFEIVKRNYKRTRMADIDR